MDNKIRQISRDIRNGKLLEENIPQLFNQLADLYNTYARVELALHYYTFYETYCDDEELWSQEAKDITAKINHIIRDNLLKLESGLKHEEAVRAVDAIRKDIMKRMAVLTAYTDMFQIYEYVLNRVEFRYKEANQPDDEEFAREILRYIFDTEDNLIINEKIKEIVGQLPVRMTRQKYFELLKNSIYAYIGSDQASLDTYLYMLRTSAMLHGEDNMDICYPGLWEKKEQLSHLDYKELSQEDYQKAFNILRMATLTLETESTIFLGLQEIVNDLYTLLLCAPYAGMVPSGLDTAREAADGMIGKVNEYFLKDKKNEIPEEISAEFTGMEGVQEEIYFTLSTLEDSLYEVNLNHRELAGSLMLEQLLEVLLRSQKLLSESLFIELEKENPKQTVDEAAADRKARELEEELAKLFAETDRMVSRAVMANTINKMPVFFSNHKEVMDYVLYSLERCSDIYEKAACFEIINGIMSE